MFPDFVTTFRDASNKVHLFYFPGMEEDGSNVWMKIDLSKSGVEFAKVAYSDGAEEFVFERTDISKITCKLIDKHGSTKSISLAV